MTKVSHYFLDTLSKCSAMRTVFQTQYLLNIFFHKNYMAKRSKITLPSFLQMSCTPRLVRAQKKVSLWTVQTLSIRLIVHYLQPYLQDFSVHCRTIMSNLFHAHIFANMCDQKNPFNCRGSFTKKCNTICYLLLGNKKSISSKFVMPLSFMFFSF